LRTSTTSKELEAVDEDGVLADIDVQSITDTRSTHADKTVDIDEFFGKPFKCAGKNGAIKNHRKCKNCL
jgi:hypothetical protein